MAAWGKKGAGKGGRGKGEPAPAAPPAPSPAAAAAAAPRASAAAAAAAVAAALDQGERYQLRWAEFMVGKQGQPVKLVTNHFEIKVADRRKLGKWLVWDVQWPDQGQPGVVLSRGRREAALAKRMEEVGVDAGHFIFDGSSRLWALEGAGRAFEGEAEVLPPPREQDAPAQGSPAQQGAAAAAASGPSAKGKGKGKPRGPDKVKIRISQAIAQDTGAQQQLDLALIGRPKDNDNISEERRFLHVLNRNKAKELGLIARGRRSIWTPEVKAKYDLDRALPSEISEANLLYARQLWFGYFAGVEAIDGPTGPRVSLNLNLVASVGLPEMSAMDLLASMLNSRQWRQYKWDDCKKWLESDSRTTREDLLKIRGALNSDLGFKGLQVSHDYLGSRRKAKVFGVGPPADEHKFELEQDGKKRVVTVAEYFDKHKKKTLRYPHLPCLMVGKRDNMIPIELLTVLGGEHNMAAGKLQSEFQAEVTKKTAMAPHLRLQGIKAVAQSRISPALSLLGHGLEMEASPIIVEGRVLASPGLQHGGTDTLLPNGWGNKAKAQGPPKYEVQWGIVSFLGDELLSRPKGAGKGGKGKGSAPSGYGGKGGGGGDASAALTDFSRELQRVAGSKGMQFARTPLLQEREEGCDFTKQEVAEMLQRYDRTTKGRLHILFVLLPNNSAKEKEVYAHIKTITELEMGTFITQCIKCDNGAAEAAVKLNNVMLKVVTKLKKDVGGSAAGHVVSIAAKDRHRLLNESTTAVIGADVTHDAFGISVAGVVLSCDQYFQSFYTSVRAQKSFQEDSNQKRLRKSQERILDLAKMVEECLACRMKDLPTTIFYYRDGVSDGQFKEVMTYELNQLKLAFELIAAKQRKEYNPRLVILVGQKGHHTRFWKENVETQAWNYGTYNGPKDKDLNVLPGTVAGKDIAQPGHLNFFLVPHQGIKGTAVPCHLHVLHMDERLSLGVDDLEKITYHLCHLYPRADKTVSYPHAAYMADHLCERAKLYLQSELPEDERSLASERMSTTSGDSEDAFRALIEKRVTLLNAKLSNRKQVTQGVNFFH